MRIVHRGAIVATLGLLVAACGSKSTSAGSATDGGGATAGAGGSGATAGAGGSGATAGAGAGGTDAGSDASGSGGAAGQAGGAGASGTSGSGGSGGAAGSGGNAGAGATAGTGGSAGAAGTAGSGAGGAADAGVDCGALIADAQAKLQKAKICTANASDCQDTVQGLCCTEVVARGDSQATQAYLAARKAIDDAGCTVACPATPCPSITTGTCATASGHNVGACIATPGN